MHINSKNASNEETLFSVNDLSTTTVMMEDFSDVITFESADSHSRFDIVSTTIASSESPEEIYVKHNLLEAEMTKTMLNESSTSESDGTSLQMITNEMPTSKNSIFIALIFV